MVGRRRAVLALAVTVCCTIGAASAQEAGGIRGTVYDKDFDAPLPGAEVAIVETGNKVSANDQGQYSFGDLPAGTYTLIFSKGGYTRQVRAGVVVSPGRVAEVDVRLAGDITEMDEFIVEEVRFDGSTEAGLMQLRLDSPALVDFISADLLSRAGAGDAAGALRHVAGASIQDGKYAVIRGLPDRYVNSQMNGVRLPTADADKRAVQLDQFPAAVIESIRVTKTFTPDQQGDASGGAVDIVLKGVPEETVFSLSSQIGMNTRVTGKSGFLSYDGGGVNYWGREERDIPHELLGRSWDGAVGVAEDDAPTDYKWSLAAGGKREIDGLLGRLFRVGGFASLFYERDSSFFEEGMDDQYWVETPGGRMTPQYVQGTPSSGEFKTQLFDVTQGGQEVKWGGLTTVGLETDLHRLALLYMYTRSTEDVATLAEDTRGKAFYFPGYNPADPRDPGNQERDAAPYLRTETLAYSERTTSTLQLSGRHTLPDPKLKLGAFITSREPQLEWVLSHSESGLYQPDKRQFGSLWWAESYDPGFPPLLPPSTDPAVHRPFKPAANFTLGNVQRVWKDILEKSDQFALNARLPFVQWSGEEGFLKSGFFRDEVVRAYDQDSFSNFNDNSARYEGPWEDRWSRHFPGEHHPITAAEIDVDYEGEQTLTAWYVMGDLPLTSKLKLIGGVRFEKTQLGILNDPESEVIWIPPGAGGPVSLQPGDADVAFEQCDALPSLALVFTPVPPVKLRASYSETVARQTFKELSPIQQQEFLGGDVFIGNPELGMSAVKNYDVRLDYAPFDGSLASVSYFRKEIRGPIEYVQRNAGFTYTTPVNYPEGRLAGFEFELRQDFGRLWETLDGLSLGANATLIDSEVTLPDEEAAQFDQPNIRAPMKTRDMTNAPDHLFNFFATCDLERWGLRGAEAAVFYSIRGDTLVAGAGQSGGRFVPSVYETQYGTLNVSLTQKLGDTWKLKFQAKNLTDPKIETVYRSEYVGDDVLKTSHRKGMEFSLSFSASF